VQLIDPPATYPPDGLEDWFCGGHTFLPDGRLLVVNGTNMHASCDPETGFTGHQDAWILNPFTVPAPTWVQAPQLDKRWYPTAKLFGDGTVGVFGHTSAPIGGLQPVHWLQWTPGPNGWITRDNLKKKTDCTAPTEDNSIFDYPRLQVLSNGQLMWADSYHPEGLHELDNDPTRYLDIGPQTWCPSVQYQWKEATTPSTLPRDGGTAQLILWNGDHGPATFKEIVYAIAGATVGVDGNDCSLPTSTFLKSVEKIVNPTATDPPPGQSLPAWVSVADLHEGRANANVTILLDGSIFVNGGVTTDGSGSCCSLFHAERFKPEEIFGGPPADWAEQNPQSVDRRYHAVAGLLPDGRVFSAGGFMLPLVYDPDPPPSDEVLDAKAMSAHTIEVFSPGYMFAPSRPTIDSTSFVVPQRVYQYNAQVVFNVHLASNASVARVAALRNGTSTHAYNPDQRYVQLEFNPPVSLGNGFWRITAFAPTDGSHAPPGYYMLTVVDNSQRPSPAEWVVFES